MNELVDNCDNDSANLTFDNIVEVHKAGEIDKALAGYQLLLEKGVNHTSLLKNYAVALRTQSRHDDAIPVIRRAFSQDDLDANAWSIYGNLLRDSDKLRQSFTAHKKAYELEPNNPLIQYNFSLVCRDIGDYSSASKLQNILCENYPQHYDYFWEHSLTLLSAGHWHSGFQLFDARIKLPKKIPIHSKPLWQIGMDIDYLLIQCEQGFGDSIQFIRYIRPLRESFSGEIYVRCQAPLIRLFESSFHDIDIKFISYEDDIPYFDAWLPLLSLPSRLCNQGDAFNFFSTPYIRTQSVIDSGLNISIKESKRVGLVWSGSPTHKNNKRRSISFDDIKELLGIDGVEWFSLQKGDAVEDIYSSPLKPWLSDMGSVCNDFYDTASVIDQLDLVVCCDTSVAHLAAAMGKPTWVLIPFVADWRWGFSSIDSPWYSSIKLFRQTIDCEWRIPINQIYKELLQKSYLKELRE